MDFYVSFSKMSQKENFCVNEATSWRLHLKNNFTVL